MSEHTERLETGIAAAVREIDELRAALEQVRKLAPTLIEDVLGAAEWGEYRRLSVREAAQSLRAVLGELEKP